MCVFSTYYFERKGIFKSTLSKIYWLWNAWLIGWLYYQLLKNVSPVFSLVGSWSSSLTRISVLVRCSSVRWSPNIIYCSIRKSLKKQWTSDCSHSTVTRKYRPVTRRRTKISGAFWRYLASREMEEQLTTHVYSIHQGNFWTRATEALPAVTRIWHWHCWGAGTLFACVCVCVLFPYLQVLCSSAYLVRVTALLGNS